MSAATLLKLIAVALAMAAGFLVGKSGRDNTDDQPAPETSRTKRAEAGQLALANSNAGSTSTSPKGSLLAETLKFERYLATCDLGLFPAVLEAEYAGPHPLERSSRMLRIWLRRDQDGCSDWVASRPAKVATGATDGTYTNLRSNLIGVVAEDDPTAAWEMADRFNLPDLDRWSILVDVLRKDPAQALEMAEAHPDIILSRKIFSLEERRGFDPMQALPLIETLHPGGGRNSLANYGISHYAKHPEELAEAGEWFQQLPADAQRFIVASLDRSAFYDKEVKKTVPKLREIWKLPEG